MDAERSALVKHFNQLKIEANNRLFQQQKAYFVTRAKDNMKYSVFEAREVDGQTGVIYDESISLTGLFTAKKYPDLLRLVVYEDFAQNVVYL